MLWRKERSWEEGKKKQENKDHEKRRKGLMNNSWEMREGEMEEAEEGGEKGMDKLKG